MNKSIEPVPNLFTYEIPINKLAVKEMRSEKIYAILLASVMLVGILSLSPAFSTLMRYVVIKSKGRISAGTQVIANSGSAEDIQAAVDQVAAMGGGNVYIPEGTFNFSDGAPWQTVNVPAGVNIFGAPTDRDANDQVIEWKTILQMPWEAPNAIVWFRFNPGGVTSTKPVRFSDIKLVGYRAFDPDATYPEYWGLDMNDVMDFRIDHCFLHYITGGISIDTSMPNGECCGVIDHCKLINEIGAPCGPNHEYNLRTVTYGVDMSINSGTTRWEPIDQVLGHYTNYTVFVEDCYFQGWRHCISSGYGAHYVFRHSTIQYDFGYGSIDAHGVYTIVGTRAVEIYDNQILDAVVWQDVTGKSHNPADAIRIRGGGGCIFNNTIDTSYQFFLYFQKEGTPPYTPHDVYIWDNNVPATGIQFMNDWGGVENVDYFLRAPNLAQDGFAYTPYPYPHPLTLG